MHIYIYLHIYIFPGGLLVVGISTSTSGLHVRSWKPLMSKSSFPCDDLVAPRHQDFRKARHPDTKASRPGSQKSRHPYIHTHRHQDIQTLRHPDTQTPETCKTQQTRDGCYCCLLIKHVRKVCTVFW